MKARPDLGRFRDAVRLRDRCRRAAMVHHERCGLTPSFAYANATFDAIVDLIRGDERDRLSPKVAPTQCEAETRSWEHFTPDQVDSYWIRCTLSGVHDAHEDENTGLTWKDHVPR